jgi:hypothetical protein
MNHPTRENPRHIGIKGGQTADLPRTRTRGSRTLSNLQEEQRHIAGIGCSSTDYGHGVWEDDDILLVCLFSYIPAMLLRSLGNSNVMIILSTGQ